jgi:hypothetical protein
MTKFNYLTVESYFIQCVITHYYDFFCCLNWPKFNRGSSVFFWVVSIDLWVLYFLAPEALGTSCYAFSASNTKTSHFSKEPWFLLMENDNLETKIRFTMCVHTHTFVSYISLSVCLHWKPLACLLIPPVLI